VRDPGNYGKHCFVLLLFVTLGYTQGCSGTGSQTAETGAALLTSQVQEKIREAASSVVGVNAERSYSTQVFTYDLVNGEPARDASSPTGYRLARGQAGVTLIDTTQEIHGGGLIIYRDEHHALILTCAHLLLAPDTILTYFRDRGGNPTGLLASRSVKKNISYYIMIESGRLLAAEVLQTDDRTDLGLLAVESRAPIGLPFCCALAYQSEIRWGDFAYVFGFPHGMKQLTAGFISPAPYPGRFVLDVAAHFGFSGGPVIVVRPGGTIELAGIILSMPVTKLRYIMPPPNLHPGQTITITDLAQSTAEELNIIEYGTGYGIGAKTVGRFLLDNASLLQRKGFALSSQYLPQ
jgi:S1-C subfamily serine protease